MGPRAVFIMIVSTNVYMIRKHLVASCLPLRHGASRRYSHHGVRYVARTHRFWVRGSILPGAVDARYVEAQTGSFCSLVWVKAYRRRVPADGWYGRSLCALVSISLADIVVASWARRLKGSKLVPRDRGRLTIDHACLVSIGPLT